MSDADFAENQTGMEVLEQLNERSRRYQNGF
jgi:hypothetical protein